MKNILQFVDENGISKIVSFDHIFREYYQTLCCFANAYVKDKETAEDIVQNRFIKLWEQNFTFQHQLQIKSWMYKAVRNACLDHIKKQQTIDNKLTSLAYIKSMETEEFKLQQMIRAEVIEEIYNAIETLPPACKRIFKMLYFEGKSLKNVAKELNLSINTIKSQKGKSLSILRKKLPPQTFLILLSFFDNLN